MKTNVTIMSFNLRCDVPTDPFVWEERKGWVEKIIETYQPDLIGTQEATVPMLKGLRDRFEDSYEIYGVNRTNSEVQGEFSAVFVKRDKFSIVKKESFMLSETPEQIGSFGWDAACERICSWVELTVKDQEMPLLRFFNTHLDHIGQQARLEGLRLIMTKIKDENSRHHLPVLLTGDFNDVPESGLLDVIEEFQHLNSSYDICSPEEKKNGLTFHDFKGLIEGSPIDYILGSQEIEFIATSIIRDRFENGFPSDHYPVLSHIRL